jgi:hypothetical protein
MSDKKSSVIALVLAAAGGPIAGGLPMLLSSLTTAWASSTGSHVDMADTSPATAAIYGGPYLLGIVIEVAALIFAIRKLRNKENGRDLKTLNWFTVGISGLGSLFLLSPIAFAIFQLIGR